MIKAARSGITRKRNDIAFRAEPAVNDGTFRSPSDGDYNGIKAKGFDRGHLLPADAMKWSLDAYHSTFNVANIGFQVSSFNQQLWQRVENQERGWACDHGKISWSPV
jgi:endonuclease G